MKLYKVRIITTPNIKNGGWTPSFKIFCKYTLFYDSLEHQEPEYLENAPHADFIPKFKKGEKRHKVAQSGKSKKKKGGDTTDEDEVSPYDAREQVLLYDDVKIEFYEGKKQKKLFHFWFHTSFVDSNGILFINREMTENAHKDKHGKKYDRNFQVKVQLSRIEKYVMEEQVLARMPRKIKKSKA